MHFSKNIVLLLLCLVSVTTIGTYADTKSYEFNIVETNITRLCSSKTIVTVNGQFPGPQIDVVDGDKLLVKVNNKVAHNITLHWHGLFQNRTGWFDGPSYVTQCPIAQGSSYLYNITITRQRGTLWWHAHITWLRATVYGALIIQPKPVAGKPPFPFLRPEEEAPIEKVFLLGEWWKSDVLDVVNQALATGGGTNLSDALTINGMPGPLYSECPVKDTFSFVVKPMRKYLFRIINAAMNTELFFAVANHQMTVVEVDANYVKPFSTSAIVSAPGQTVTVLLTTDQPVGKYYIAARAFVSAPIIFPFTNSTTAAVLSYEGSSPSSLAPVLPQLPVFNASDFVEDFNSKIRSAKSVRREAPVPVNVDKNIFIEFSLNIQNCPPGASNLTCQANGGRFAASMNNVSYMPPKIAILQQHYNQVHNNQRLQGLTLDFPTQPVSFNFTSNPALTNLNTVADTRAMSIPYGSNVQMVLQGTSLVFPESHPIHLHGHDFYVVASGVGNYDSKVPLNLKDPPSRNTVGVPAAGWVVIRFKTENPGAWIMHCHLDMHSTLGLVTTFIVTDGQGPGQSLTAPPADLPKC